MNDEDKSLQYAHGHDDQRLTLNRIFICHSNFICHFASMDSTLQIRCPKWVNSCMRFRWDCVRSHQNNEFAIRDIMVHCDAQWNMISLTKRYEWISNKTENDRIPQCEFCLSTESQTPYFRHPFCNQKWKERTKTQIFVQNYDILHFIHTRYSSDWTIGQTKQRKAIANKRYGAFTLAERRRM